MSNSFTSPPVLASELTTVAGQPITEGAISKMSETANYLFAVGGTHNVISQAWAEGQFNQQGTTYQTMVEYRIPTISNDHYDFHLHFIAKGAGCVRSTLTLGAATYTDEVCSTGSGPHVIESSILVTVLSTATYGTLTIEVKHTTGSPNHHEITCISGHWVAKTSPVDTGARYFGTSDKFIPFGINRVGNDYPLSARWGVDMLRNIEMLRRRPITYLTWSGVDNLLHAPTSGSDAAPALYLGLGDIFTMSIPVHIPQEAVDLDGYTIYLHAYLVDNAGSVAFDFMGDRITFSGNGWKIAELTIQADTDESMSQIYDLNIYRVGPENTLSNTNTLVDAATVPFTDPKIQSLSIWGV